MWLENQVKYAQKLFVKSLFYLWQIIAIILSIKEKERDWPAVDSGT